jgi:prepilin-type N-terminal cleavage/methylation domain-containing protein
MWANKKNNTSIAPLEKIAQSGFTIIETLIVLAVTSSIFISASLLIAGQIERTQQKGGIAATGQYLQNTLNDVEVGIYPLPSTNPGCALGGVAASGIIISGTSNRGSNLDCAFAGKKVTFNSSNIVVDTVLVKATKTTSGWNTSELEPVPTLAQTYNYPYGITKDTATSVSYYVLNSLINPQLATDAVFQTGAQNADFYSVGGGGALTKVDSTDQTIYLCNGNRKSYVKLNNAGGSVNVEYNVGNSPGC